MFDIISISELFVIAVVILIVMGPERLPDVLRTAGLWLGRLRRSFNSVKSEIESEIGMDDIRRQLHNEAVMEEMRRIEAEVKGSADDARIDPNPAPSAATTTDPSADLTADAPDPDVPGPVAAPSPDPEPAPRPRSEAELEALHARKTQAGESSS